MSKKIIEEMYAFISKDSDGSEGVIAMKVGDTFFPLVGADMERMDSLRNTAFNIGKITNKPIRLLKFKLVSYEVIDELK